MNPVNNNNQNSGLYGFSRETINNFSNACKVGVTVSLTVVDSLVVNVFKNIFDYFIHINVKDLELDLEDKIIEDKIIEDIGKVKIQEKPQKKGPPKKKAPRIEEVKKYPGLLTTEEKREKFHLKFNEEKTNLDIGLQNFKVSIRAQDIFESGATVIVNAANTDLGGGGGIDGLIHKKGGASYAHKHKRLSEEYESNYPNGYAVMIQSGELAKKLIKRVIVVAGPFLSSRSPVTDDKRDQLYSCFFNSLALAHLERVKINKTKRMEKITSIAFPAISCGIYHFPYEEAAPIFLRALSDFAEKYPDTALKTISLHVLPKEKELLNHYFAAATPDDLMINNDKKLDEKDNVISVPSKKHKKQKLLDKITSIFQREAPIQFFKKFYGLKTSFEQFLMASLSSVANIFFKK